MSDTQVPPDVEVEREPLTKGGVLLWDSRMTPSAHHFVKYWPFREAIHAANDMRFVARRPLRNLELCRCLRGDIRTAQQQPRCFRSRVPHAHLMKMLRMCFA